MSITRRNAGVKEQKTSTQAMSFLKTNTSLCKEVGGILSIKDISKERGKHADYLVVGNNRSIYVDRKMSGVGTDINTTFRVLKEKGIIESNAEDILNEYRLTRRVELQKVFPDIKFPKTTSDLEKFLYNNRNTFGEFLNGLWYSFINKRLIVSIGVSPIQGIESILPPYKWFEKTNKLFKRINTNDLQERLSKTSLEIRQNVGVFLSIKEPKEDVLIFRLHWKNGIGAKTFCCNGWASTNLYSEIK